MLKTISENALYRSYNRARDDLREVGLLEDGKYLDRIECYRALLPRFWTELGYVFDRGVPSLAAAVGFEPGMIYIPYNANPELYVPGNTLTDTIRHEFAHSWAWLDKRFVDGPWFRKTFGARYTAEWSEQPEFDRDHYISEYATTAPCEDFAETFMYFLKYRRTLDRFAGRPGVRRKLRAVQQAVKKAAKDRAPRVRGERT